MATLVAIDRNGEVHRLQGRDRASFMELLKMNGLPVAALCGGSCQCATCHVYIEPTRSGEIPPRSEIEMLTLESEAEPEQIRDESRLACQITWRDDYDGIRVTLAPEF